MNRPIGFDAPTWPDSWLTPTEARAARNAPKPAPTSLELYQAERRQAAQTRPGIVAAAKVVGGALAGIALVAWCVLWLAFI